MANKQSKIYRIHQDLANNLPIRLASNNQTKEAEIITTKEIKAPFSLISTIDKTNIAKTNVETDGHYYIVKEIIVSLDGLTTIDEKEYEFYNNTMYNNKIEARLFFDSKTTEIAEMLSSDKPENTQTKLEVYLVRNSNLVEHQKHLLIDSNGVENIENRGLESFLLSSMGANKRASTNSDENFISTKNSFLDGDYKD